MTRQSKQEAALAAIETELASRLRAILPGVVAGSRTAIFINQEFNPHNLLAAHYDADSDDLLRLSREAEKLREQLELPSDEGPAHLYLEACQELADLGDPHRLGPRRLAERVLDRLGAAQQGAAADEPQRVPIDPW